MNIGENYLSNLEFEDYDSGTTFEYWTASTDKLLWKNSRLNTMVFSNEDARANSAGIILKVIIFNFY